MNQRGMNHGKTPANICVSAFAPGQERARHRECNDWWEKYVKKK